MKITLKAARVNTGLTQETVCKDLGGIAKSTLINWEMMRTYPTVPQLKRLCELYNCKMDDIFVPETLPKSKQHGRRNL